MALRLSLLALLLAPLLASSAEAWPRGPRVVRGLAGDPPLVLDLRHPPKLAARARVETLDRVVACARKRLPCRGASCEVYARLGRGPVRLSQAVARGIGACRERAFLLSAMLGEAGVRHRVRYGLRYDATGNPGTERHAWVEARVDGRRWLLDPAFCSFALPIDRVAVAEELRGGRIRNTEGARAGDAIYVPVGAPRYDRPGERP